MTIARRPRTAATVLGAASMLFWPLACAPGLDMVRTNNLMQANDLVQTNPGLYPSFQLSVSDYVNRCDPNDPTDVTVEAPAGTTVSVAGQAPQSGTFTTAVDQQVNERFRLVVTRGATRTVHHVRCLPLDFPRWSAVRTGRPHATFYATTIVEGFVPNYPVIFDTNGVPVWWTDRQPSALLAPLPNGNLATLGFNGGMVERRLDGRLVRRLNTRGAPSDFHDVLLLPNGHYVLATFDIRRCNLSAWGEGRSRCIFHEFQQLTRTGRVVWRWRPETDIGIRETPRRWRNESPIGVADPWHYNSVEWTGDGFIISFRHLDAIFKIDYGTKNVVWKLGGRVRRESLRVIGDPVFRTGGSISGQHDARQLRRRVITLFDNGTGTGRAPRAVVYRINERARTATLLRRVTDRIALRSGCCGSTRVLRGNHITGWGARPWISENEPDGTQVFRLNATFVYRVVPIGAARYSRPELRAAMDAQYDDGVFAHASVAPVSRPDSELFADLASRLGLSAASALGD